MKKILALTSVLALAACSNSIDTAAMDAHFAGCERVDTTKTHLVYKCPSSQEWIASVKAQEPDAMFKEGGNLVWDDVNADTENTYVEVVAAKEGACAEDFHFRVMVKPVNTETKEMYAVVTCKTPAEKPAEEPAAEEKPAEEAAK